MLHSVENLLPIVPGLPEAERIRRQKWIDGAEAKVREMMQEFLPKKKRAKTIICPIIGKLNFKK